MESRFKNRIIGYGEEQVDQIMFNPQNWRIHPKSQQDALTGVLEEVGWVQNVIVNKRTGHLVDGHLRVQLADRAGEKTIPVTYVDLSESEEMTVLATIDPIAAMAATDKEKLDEVLRQVHADDARIQKAIADLAANEGLYKTEDGKDTDPQIDKAEELRIKWGVETGQLWELGAHRLICGDCTDVAVVDLVMAGEKASAVLTDPPYGQNQNGVPGDNPEDHAKLMRESIKLLPITDGIIVAFQSPRTFHDWTDAMRNSGFLFERMLWMYKSAQCTFPWRGWILTSESIPVCSIGNQDWQEIKPFSHDCYYLSEVSGELEKDFGWHGSVKPISVVSDILSRICVGSAIVYDPFVGSGTTLIACENLGRKCRAIEIDPGYVAVALERWHQHTGKTPKLIS
jgi:DNA modification methylase